MISKKKEELLKNDDFLEAVMIYRDRPTFKKSVKQAVRADRERNTVAQQTVDALLVEVMSDLESARAAELGIGDDDYCKIAKNIDLLADAAEKVDRIKDRDFQRKETIFKDLGDSLEAAGTGVADVIFKSPYTMAAKKVGKFIGGIFGGNR